MAVTIKDNTKNGDQWNEWATLLDSAIYDEDAQQNDYDDLVKAIAVEKKSKRWGEKSTTIGGLGDYEVKTEGADAAEDTYVEGYSKFVEHMTFAKDFSISKEMRDDNQLDEAMTKAKNMVSAYKRTRAKYASQMLTSSVGATTTMTFGGRSGIDISGADGLALFNAAHPLKNSFVSGTTNVTECNLFSDVLGSDASILNKAANRLRNFKDDRGEVLGFDADTIILPGNDPEYEDFVKRVIGSDGEVGSNHNDINTQRGKWKLVVDYLWTPASGHPSILMSSKALKALEGTKFYDRTPLDIENEVKISSRNMVYNGFARFAMAFTNWRHVLMLGSSDATALTL